MSDDIWEEFFDVLSEHVLQSWRNRFLDLHRAYFSAPDYRGWTTDQTPNLTWAPNHSLERTRRRLFARILSLLPHFPTILSPATNRETAGLLIYYPNSQTTLSEPRSERERPGRAKERATSTT